MAGYGSLGATFGSPAQDRVLVDVYSNNDILEDERVDYSNLDYSFEYAATPISIEAGSNPVAWGISSDCNFHGTSSASSPGIPSPGQKVFQATAIPERLSQGLIFAKVEAVIDGKVVICGRKKAKLTSTDEKKD
ncbi:hypothetical protein D5086_033208 [Populus alba]|uniref:Uncharacterized protein n=1 Tax=Populus alba TaxID=43335 RepID=A0ACC4AH09_POPAL